MLGYIFDPTRRRRINTSAARRQKDGAWSILTGIAANKAIATGAKVNVDRDAARRRGSCAGAARSNPVTCSAPRGQAGAFPTPPRGGWDPELEPGSKA